MKYSIYILLISLLPMPIISGPEHPRLIAVRRTISQEKIEHAEQLELIKMKALLKQQEEDARISSPTISRSETSQK